MTSATMSLPGSHDWYQFYDHHSSINEDHPYNNFSDSTIAAATTVPDTIVSPTDGSDRFMSPNKPNPVSKPVRRRCRASKRTPTTLLNANINNFRALVQKFTGCPSKSPPLRAQKGPVNLNFQLGSVQTDPTPADGNNCSSSYHYHHQQAQVQELQEQVHGGQVVQQCMVSVDNMTTSYGDQPFFSMCSTGDMEVEDGFYVGQDVDSSWHEFPGESVTGSNVSDGYF